MGRPADWMRGAGLGAVAAAPPPPADPVADLEAQRMRLRKQAEIDTMTAEIEEERRQRELTRRINSERQMRALENLAKGGGDDDSGGGSAAFKALQAVVQDLSNDRAELLRTLQETQTRLFEQINEGQRQQMLALEQRVATMAAPSTNDPLTALVAAARNLKEVREAVETALPAPIQPHIDPGLSRHDALERLRIEGEVAVRTLEAQGRLEESRAKRESNRQDYEMRSKRIDGAFGAVSNILGPALGNLAGDKLGGLLGGGEAGGAAAETAPGVQSFACPRCGKPVTVQASENSVVCSFCHEMLIRPGTAAAEPPGSVQPGDAGGWADA